MFLPGASKVATWPETRTAVGILDVIFLYVLRQPSN